MKTKTRRTRHHAEVKFENRIRFNWGFHDAVQVVEEGWNTPERNFGFARSAGWVLTRPEDVLAIHPDHEYAAGWISGYERKLAGEQTTSSEPAWNDALHNELVHS
jgi:hypothetical protein